MALQVNEKNKIKFDEQEKNYIYYRVISKSELEDHLAEAKKNLTSNNEIVATFQAYVDDERIVEEESL